LEPEVKETPKKCQKKGGGNERDREI